MPEAPSRVVLAAPLASNSGLSVRREPLALVPAYRHETPVHAARISKHFFHTTPNALAQALNLTTVICMKKNMKKLQKTVDKRTAYRASVNSAQRINPLEDNMNVFEIGIIEVVGTDYLGMGITESRATASVIARGTREAITTARDLGLRVDYAQTALGQTVGVTYFRPRAW